MIFYNELLSAQFEYKATNINVYSEFLDWLKNYCIKSNDENINNKNFKTDFFNLEDENMSRKLL